MTATIPICVQTWGQGQFAAAQAAADADLADKAADLIMANGHHKGSVWLTSEEPDGIWEPGIPLCVVGAIQVSVGWTKPWERMGTRECKRLDRVMIALTRALGGDSPHRWNDRPERTADDVIDVLRRTAKTLREES